MAESAESVLEIMRVIAGFSGELEGMSKQASRLAARLLALEPAVARIKRSSEAFPREAYVTLLEIAESTRDVLDSFRESSSWSRVLKRHFFERHISWLTTRIQETAPNFGGDVDASKWGEDDELDRLEDIERMLERIETMQEGASQEASKEEVSEAIAALTQDRRNTIKSWQEIDVDELELVGGLGALTLGTFSTTRPARWRDDPVALKIVADYHGVSHSTIRALREKARAHQELSSPFIVKFHGACTFAPHLCFIVEYAWKGSLAWFLHDSPEPLPYPIQLAFLLDITQGMQVLHEKGILHRDLKSTNVLLSKTNQLKLCDFALADVMAESVRPTMAGTAAWMAPEELESYGATKKTDLYSFGMMCFEVATRQYPFRGMSEPQIVYEVMIRGSRPSFPKFPLEKEVVGLMENCWQKDPAYRPDSFHRVAERLEGLLSAAGGDPRKSGDVNKAASSGFDARASMMRKESNPLMWISRQSSLISDSSGGKSAWKSKPFRTSFGLPLDRKSPEGSFTRRAPALTEDSVSVAECPTAENKDEQASAPETSPMARGDTARLEQLVAHMSQTLQKQGEEAQARLDHVLAMTRALRAESFETPRLACVLPHWRFELPRGLSSTEQQCDTWLKRLQEWKTGGFRDGKGWVTKHLRLFPVCARTYRLVPCGVRGQGYEIRRSRTWVKSTFTLLDTMVENATAYLGLSSSLNLQKAFDNAMGIDHKEPEGVTSMTVGVRESLTERMGSKPSLRPMKSLEGKAYTILRDFIHETEANASQEKMKSKVAEGSFVSFKDVMERVQQADHDGNMHWILKEEVEPPASNPG